MSTVVPDVERLAVVRANGIGDFLMVIPALEALRRVYPSAVITLIGDAWLPALVDGRPWPWDEAVVAPCFPGLRGLPVDAPVGDDVQPFLGGHAGRYDVAIQLHGGGRTSNELVRGSSSPGSAPGRARTTPARWTGRCAKSPDAPRSSGGWRWSRSSAPRRRLTWRI